MKRLAKILKFIRFLVLFIAFIATALVIMVRSNAFQQRAIQYVAGYLSNEMQTRVSIGRIEIKFFRTVVLEDILIEDQSGDTLIFAGKLYVNLHRYDSEKLYLRLNKVVITDCKVHFGQHINDSVPNYQFFLDFIDGGPRDTTKPRKIFTLHTTDLRLINTSFRWLMEGEEPPDDRKFDENNFHFYAINGQIRDFKVIDDSLDFNILALSSFEKCGLQVKQISAKTKIHAQGMVFDSLQLVTNKSFLGNSLSFQYTHWRDLSHFVERVPMKAELSNSKIHFDDLAFFSDYLKGIATFANVSGSAYGTIDNFKVKNLHIKGFEWSELHGDLSIRGLPDTEGTYLDCKIERLQTTQKDLAAILQTNSLPENIKLLGVMSYSGRYSGFYNDFVAFGMLQTALGAIRSDINMKFIHGFDNASYSGSLFSSGFDLGRFYGLHDIGKIGLDIKVEGNGLRQNNFDINLNGYVNSLQYRNYNYHKIKVSGEFSPKLFSGFVQARDPNLNMDFNGSVDFSGYKPRADFKADIVKADLYLLGFDTLHSVLSANVSLDLDDIDIDSAVGFVSVQNLDWERGVRKLKLNEISLESGFMGPNRKITLRSDIADAEIKGNYVISKLPTSFQDFASSFLPKIISAPSIIPEFQQFTYVVQLKKPELITSILLDELKIGKGVWRGNYFSNERIVLLEANNQFFNYENISFGSPYLRLVKEAGKNLQISFNANSYDFADLVKGQKINLTATLVGELIDYKLKFADSISNLLVTSEGNLSIGKDSVTVIFDGFTLKLENEKWQMNRQASVVVTNTRTEIKNVSLENALQKIYIQGKVSDLPSDTLSCSVSAFQLSVFNKVMSGLEQRINGKATGTINYFETEGHSLIESKIDVDNLELNGDTIGDLSFVSHNIPGTNNQSIQAYIKGGLLDSMQISGKILPTDKKQNFDLKMVLKPSKIKILEPFLLGEVTGLTGKFSSDIELKGTFERPDLRGKIKLENIGMTVEYLNAKVFSSGVVEIRENEFVLNKTKIADEHGNIGFVKGTLYHDHLHDFYLESEILSLNNFHVLNTQSSDNELFYGSAYADGHATFSGPLDYLEMKMHFVTRPKTKIYIPITDDESQASLPYVSFKSEKKKVVAKAEEIDFLKKMELEIEATPDAEVEIIFDPLLADKMRGNGQGVLKFELDRKGEFSMFGNYVVESGDYHFTALNVISKKFFLQKGGVISWDGDPYKARMNLTAYYKARTSPAPLLVGVTQGVDAKQNQVDVLAEMYLKGFLFTPEISFGLNLPNLEQMGSSDRDELNRIVKRIQSDQEEVSRQVFSVLIFNKFITPTFIEGSANSLRFGQDALSTSVGELFTSQLSNWLNQIDPRWQVNLNYTRAENDQQRAEFIISLGRKWINDRLQTDVSIDPNNTYGPSINIEYKITSDGKLRVKAYSRSGLNSQSNTAITTPSTTYGLGIFYRKEFDYIFKKKKSN